MLPRHLLALGSGLLAVIASFAACDGAGLVELARDPLPGGGGTPIVDAGPEDAADAAPDAPPDSGDAGKSPVLLGITANPPAGGPNGPTAEDELTARLTTFAAGVRVAVVSRAWRDLDDAAFASLASEAALYAGSGKLVVLNLAVIDRLADQRPDDLADLAWDDPLVAARLDQTVDALLAAFSASPGALAYLTFGRDVDLYLAQAPGERQGFAALASHALGYAGDHPAAPGLGVGVGFSFEGATAPDPSFVDLRGASDVAVLSYLPSLEGGPPPAGGIAGQVDALVAAAAGKPIVLQAFGRSSVGDDGSDEGERLFYEGFFDVLEQRRGAFTVVDAFELHDLGQDACDAYVTAQGEPPGGAFAAAYCFHGLKTAAGTDKPAWAEVLSGAARFASP